jgi:hypothetical protein
MLDEKLTIAILGVTKEDLSPCAFPTLLMKVQHIAGMLRLDLAAAAIPVEVDGPEGTETRDFHALRACYISNIIRAGADPQASYDARKTFRPEVDLQAVCPCSAARLGGCGRLASRGDRPGHEKPAQPSVLQMTGTDGGLIPDVLAGGNRRVRLKTNEEAGDSGTPIHAEPSE